jgi:putative copper export protein
VKTDVPRGTYLVTYRVVSADSHPVGASFTYSYGAPSAGSPVPVESAGHIDPAVRVGIAFSRYLGYAGLILLAGPALALLALWPRRLSRTGPIRLAFAGLALIAVSTVLEFVLEAPYSTGTGLFGFSGGDLRAVFDSAFGHAHLARLAIVAAAAFLLRPFLAGSSGPAERVLLGILAAVGIFTWPWSGHSGSSAAPLLTLVADAAHLTGMAVWVGGLVILAGFLLRLCRPRELRAILPVWSTWATIAVSVVVLSGVAQALIEVASVDALLHTGYGQLVLAKAGVLVLVLAAAAASRRIAIGPAAPPDEPASPGPDAPDLAESHLPDPDLADPDHPEPGPDHPEPGSDHQEPGPDLTELGPDRPEPELAATDPEEVDPDAPADVNARESDEPHPDDPRLGEPERVGLAAAGDDPGVRRRELGRLRRTVLAEILGVLLILGLASVLVQTTPARTAAANSAAEQGTGGPFSVTLTTDLYQVQIDIDPARTGDNTVHLFAYTPQGAPLKVLNWSAKASLPGGGIEPLDVLLLPLTDSHATGQVTLPVPGRWQFTVTLRVSKFDQATTSTTVTVT